MQALVRRLVRWLENATGKQIARGPPTARQQRAAAARAAASAAASAAANRLDATARRQQAHTPPVQPPLVQHTRPPTHAATTPSRPAGAQPSQRQCQRQPLPHQQPFAADTSLLLLHRLQPRSPGYQPTLLPPYLLAHDEEPSDMPFRFFHQPSPYEPIDEHAMVDLVTAGFYKVEHFVRLASGQYLVKERVASRVVPCTSASAPAMDCAACSAVWLTRCILASPTTTATPPARAAVEVPSSSKKETIKQNTELNKSQTGADAAPQVTATSHAETLMADRIAWSETEEFKASMRRTEAAIRHTDYNQRTFEAHAAACPATRAALNKAWAQWKLGCTEDYIAGRQFRKCPYTLAHEQEARERNMFVKDTPVKGTLVKDTLVKEQVQQQILVPSAAVSPILIEPAPIASAEPLFPIKPSECTSANIAASCDKQPNRYTERTGSAPLIVSLLGLRAGWSKPHTTADGRIVSRLGSHAGHCYHGAKPTVTCSPPVSRTKSQTRTLTGRITAAFCRVLVRHQQQHQQHHRQQDQATFCQTRTACCAWRRRHLLATRPSPRIGFGSTSASILSYRFLVIESNE
ncbi:hypothetical protein BC831DRAFT_38713 [Entophlyctis helioformis]|nr:hypothetical protein BC831DRAFT_38713 [Entophlyctis helioformis]